MVTQNTLRNRGGGEIKFSQTLLSYFDTQHSICAFFTSYCLYGGPRGSKKSLKNLMISRNYFNQKIFCLLKQKNQRDFCTGCPKSALRWFKNKFLDLFS